MKKSKRAKSSLMENRLKGGRRYWTNYYGEVVQIECACCHKVKPASAFHTNNFKKFGKQEHCMICNNKILEGKIVKETKYSRNKKVNTYKLNERQMKVLDKYLMEENAHKKIIQEIEDLKKVKIWLDII